MTSAAGRSAPVAPIDLRRASLAAVRATDFRDPSRDFFADEAAIWDRFALTWAGLDDLAWRLPGAAPSDAGGPDWSHLEHAAHVVDWLEIAAGFLGPALTNGVWPSDEDYDGGDFDRFNERRRERWASMEPTEIVARGDRTRSTVLELVRRFRPEAIREDAAWGWIFMVLHGHVLDHLAVLEPWADVLRRRQTDSDPFGGDPYETAPSREATRAFLAAEASVFQRVLDTIGVVDERDWTAGEVTPGWTLKDHVGHVGAWLEEGASAIDEHGATGTWREYTEGEDEWNARAVLAWRPQSTAAVRQRVIAAREAVVDRVRALPQDVLWSYEGIGWTYEVLHGHVRRHLAMVGPWCARRHWPAPDEDSSARA